LLNNVKKKILIVEDETDVATVLAMLLEAQEYEVIRAKDGPQALEKARREKPDLILLDIMLPKIDGFKVARMLKFDENFRHIPIIMLTAKIQEKDRRMGMETGADAYVTKPFDNSVLLQRISEILVEAKQNG
jgi:DNA-binding response OmpR family regulator